MVQNSLSPSDVLAIGRRAKSAYNETAYPQPFTRWLTGAPTLYLLGATALTIPVNLLAIALRNPIASEAALFPFLASVVTLGTCWLLSIAEMGWQGYRALQDQDERSRRFDEIDRRTRVSLSMTDGDDRQLLFHRMMRIRKVPSAIIGAANFAVMAYVFHGVSGLSRPEAYDFVLHHQMPAIYLGAWFGFGYAATLMIGKFAQDDIDLLELSLEDAGHGRSHQEILSGSSP